MISGLSAHRARPRLSAELALFRTEAERTELEHILSRHPAEQTAQIREILFRQDLARARA